MYDDKTYNKFRISTMLLFFAVFNAVVLGTVDRNICFIAMCFSFLGDILLMNFMGIGNKLKFISNFYAGAISFIFAHITYAIAFTYLLNSGNHDLENSGEAIMMIVLFAIICIMLFMANKKGIKASWSKIIAISIYVAIISINAVIIASAAYAIKGIKYVSALGIILFVISDAFKGYEQLTKVETPFTRTMVWVFYPLGQFLILLGC